jgi:Sulfotransferase family
MLSLTALLALSIITPLPPSKCAVYPTGPPDIFFLGVPKAGTTSLHKYLTSLPQFCGGKQKEYHYFTFHHRSKESLDSYIDNYSVCKPHQLTIDGSPSTSSKGMNPIGHIYHSYSTDSLARKKYILILREPIDRMLSW